MNEEKKEQSTVTPNVSKTEKKKFYKKWWFWVIVVVLLIGILGYEEEPTENNSGNDNGDKQTEQKEQTKKPDVVTFLPQSNGKDFFTILCDVIEANKSECNESKATTLGDSTLYSYSNTEYSFDVETNNKGEVNQIEMIVYSGDNYQNFFNAISRFEYSTADKSTIFNWVTDNLGKEATTKVGDANFKLSLTTSKKPYLCFRWRFLRHP